jgi:hypothetical protein
MMNCWLANRTSPKNWLAGESEKERGEHDG